MPVPPADRNLLFGLLALQMGLVTRDQLIEAMHAWLLEKHTPLGEILCRRGVLDGDDCADIENLATRHLKRHGGDPQASIAALPVGPEVLHSLAGLGAEVPTWTPPPGAAAATPGPVAASGRYQRLRPHARGGLGEVHVARDPELGREVALKEIQDRFADDPGARARFLREAEITGRLEHPGIVPVYGLDADERGRPRYAMRFIHGDSLAEAVKQFHAADPSRRDPAERELALRGLLTRFVAVCNAVAYAHSRGVIHRDLKPANVMLGPYGETLVVDWGLATTMAEWEGTTLPDPPIVAGVIAPAPTQQGQVVGTPAYMPPEQARGEHDRVGPAADIFSLGATLYCILTGQAPYPGPATEALEQAVRGEVRPARQVNGRVPAALEAVCHKAMAPRPEDRYARAGELAGEVERWLADEPVSAYPDPWAARAGRWARRHRTLAASLAVLLATAVVALSVSTAAVAAEQRRTARQKALADEAARRAHENYDIASRLTNELVTIVETRLPQVGGAEPVRKALLDAALPAFNRVLQRRPDDPNLMEWTARLHSYSANLRRQLGEADDAESLYREAIRLETALVALQPDEPAHRDRLAQTWRDHASLCKKVGRLSEAAESLDRSADVAEGLIAGRPGDPAFRRTLALTLLERADVQYQRGRSDDSLRSADRAVELYRGLAGLPAEQAHTLDPLLFTLALNRVGAARRALGQPDEALKAHDEAAARLRSMLQRGDEPNVRHFLARTLLDQATVFRLKEDQGERAGKALDEARGIWEELARTFPHTPFYREFLALAHTARGEYLLARGKEGPAGEDLTTAREVLEKLAKENSRQPSYHANLGRVYAATGRLAERQGQPARAGEWYRRAAGELRQAGKADPENALDRKALELAEGALKRLGG